MHSLKPEPYGAVAPRGYDGDVLRLEKAVKDMIGISSHAQKDGTTRQILVQALP